MPKAPYGQEEVLHRGKCWLAVVISIDYGYESVLRDEALAKWIECYKNADGKCKTKRNIAEKCCPEPFSFAGNGFSLCLLSE